MTPHICACGCGRTPTLATSRYLPGHCHRGRFKRTDDELLEELRTWAAKHEGVWPAHPARSRLAVRFGSFAAACERAGIDPSPYWWPKDRIVRALQAYNAKHGHAPTNREWQRSERGSEYPSTATVRQVFGSWGAALATAGLTPQPSGRRAQELCIRGHRKNERGDCLTCRAARRREIGQRERMLTAEMDLHCSQAVDLVRQGWSARAAARRMDINKNSLLKRIRKHHPELVSARRTISALEDRVAAALDVMGVQYERQVAVETAKSFCVIDFVIGHVALEVNGTYWHTDPRAYPRGPRYAAQHRAQESWGSKVAAIEAAGLELRVVWEMDLDLDMPGTLAAAMHDQLVAA